MLKKSFFILMLCLSSSMALAATKSPIKQYGQASPDKALVYLLRPARLMASLRTMFVYSDQNFLGTIDNNSYTYAYVEPGNHLIWANWTNIQKNIEFIAGQTYYLNIWMPLSIVPTNQGSQMVAYELSHYASATEKEIKVAQNHISKRYKRAVKKMQKDDYAPIQTAPAQMVMSAPQPGSVALPVNTPIQIKLMENVTSGYSQVGDEVSVQVIQNVMKDGKVLVAAGTRAKAIVNHKSKGKKEIGGDLDVVISGIPAVDGTMVPVAGLLSRTAKDRSQEAAGRTILFGVVGYLSMGSRESYLFSQETFSVPTKQEVWIKPQETLATAQLAAIPGVAQGVKIHSGVISKSIAFKPHKKSKMADVKVDLPQEFRWDQLKLVSAGGIPLARLVAAKEKSEKSQSFIFNAWDIVRHLPLNAGQTQYRLDFLGQSGGHDFPVSATAEVQVKAK